MTAGPAIQLTLQQRQLRGRFFFGMLFAWLGAPCGIIWNASVAWATGCHSPRPVSRHHENAIKTTYDAFTSEQGPELFPYSPLGFTREESTSRGLVGRLCEAKNAESTSTVERLLKGEPLKNITGLRQFDIFPFLLYLKLDLLYLFFLQSGGKRSYQIF